MRGEFLDLSGARLYYYAAGTRGGGVPVVFIHGFATSSHLWSEVVPLMPAGHRVVVVDLLGHGRSDRPLRRPVDVRGHAARMIELFDELHIHRACVIGHGVGGGIAQSLAVRWPERVSHLCLVDSVAFTQWPTIEARLARLSLPLTRFLPPAVFCRILRRDLERGYTDRVRATHSVDLYLRAFSTPEGRDALVSHIRELTNDETAEMGVKLGGIVAPTALIWGEDDRVVPVTAARRLQAMIPGATLDVIADGRHFTPEESPRPVVEAIQRLLARGKMAVTL